MKKNHSMKTSIFLSHNYRDKEFVRKLALDLECHGIRVWLDEAELKIGDSLIEKIRDGIDNVNYVAVILSPNSIESRWVQKEIDVAMTLEINGKEVKVLPLMLELCELPGFLLGKFYGDFTNKNKYEDTFKSLVNTMGIVFNRSAVLGLNNNASLGDAIGKAEILNLYFYPKPFHRPFQYIGMRVEDALKEVNGTINSGGNIIVESDDCYMNLEAEGSFINFVEVDIKNTAPCNIEKTFDPEPILGCLSINPSELDLVRAKIHAHVYYDHKRKLSITVQCLYDDSPLTVSFSTKNYKI